MQQSTVPSSVASAVRPSLGRIVHYVLPWGSKHCGEHRAAIITGLPRKSDVNLMFYIDQPDDIKGCSESHVEMFGWTARAPAVEYDESGSPGTWHWPERE